MEPTAEWQWLVGVSARQSLRDKTYYYDTDD